METRRQNRRGDEQDQEAKKTQSPGTWRRAGEGSGHEMERERKQRSRRRREREGTLVCIQAVAAMLMFITLLTYYHRRIGIKTKMRDVD